MKRAKAKRRPTLKRRRQSSPDSFELHDHYVVFDYLHPEYGRTHRCRNVLRRAGIFSIRFDYWTVLDKSEDHSSHRAHVKIRPLVGEVFSIRVSLDEAAELERWWTL